jgi:hypothetical protein
LLPPPAREVRKLDGSAALPHGPFTELYHRAQDRRVVDVHVRRQAAAQAVHQTIIVHVVHRAVAAVLAVGTVDGAPQRMLILS